MFVYGHICTFCLVFEECEKESVIFHSNNTYGYAYDVTNLVRVKLSVWGARPIYM